MEENRRTVTCGELNLNHVGKTAILNGWVHRKRDHGVLQFINLRDRYGVTQVVVDDDAPEELKAVAAGLKLEHCIAVTGVVRARPEGMVNPDMPTGAVELVVTDSLELLNTSPPLPFMLDGDDEPNENIRLTHRYLDLRSSGMRNRLELRHKTTWEVRRFLTKKGFWEVETPTLIRSTPEGARDYLVPSRVNPGRFYALPQSPQLYKQMLMVGGVDRYYQIARCYRDEDPRGDRQPEFTQIDLEMSFVSRDDVLSLAEGMMVQVFKETLGVEIPRPFPRLSWKQAMDEYGTDKPDLRFGMRLQNFNPYVDPSEFGVFKTVIKEGGAVKAMVVKGAAELYSRKKIADLEETAKGRGCKGLAWMKVTGSGLDGGVSRFFADQTSTICADLNAENGDLILLAGADWKTAVTALGAVRDKLSKNLKLANPDEHRFCWIVDFPLFEKNEETGNWEPVHHLFSMPQERFLDDMEGNPGEVLGDLYDMVLNGNELASGSVRIHDPQIQARVFNIVGITEEEAEKRFGFFLNALRHSAPPHAGLAVGFDRMVMVMAQADTIREVIAFPKNTHAVSPMDGCPSPVNPVQLDELNLILRDE